MNNSLHEVRYDAAMSDEVQVAAGELIATAVRKLGLPIGEAEAEPHMGALITDAALQAGLNYKSVVAPRVRHVRDQYPFASTTSAFLDALERFGPSDVMRWTDPTKVDRARGLAKLFLAEGVETVDELRVWCAQPESRAKLLALKGIGEKTADYVAILAGVPDAVAVDVQLARFAKEAGVDSTAYTVVQAAVFDAAAILGVDPAALDHAIWRYESNRRLLG